MMTSNPAEHAYVWHWLPSETSPVIAGKLQREGNVLVFNYGRSYLARKNAISLYDRELPLKSGRLANLNGLTMPGCLRDGSPDAWGRRVIVNKLTGSKGNNQSAFHLDELTFLLESGSDRIGSLDFQASATEYVPRQANQASLEELLDSAERVEKGQSLHPALDTALFHGSSIGGARPKALITHDKRKYIAKFSSSSDLYNVVKAEFIAMQLAAFAGLDVANVMLTTAAGRDVLLIERFDREKAGNAWQRKSLISALTLHGLDEMLARYTSYQTLAEVIRQRFTEPTKTLHELFARLTFNILCGNNDDHARNHAAFWDGQALCLTPAYDICPQPRTGNESSQAMLIFEDQRQSQLSLCMHAAPSFLLSADRAHEIIAHQVSVIQSRWHEVCELAQLSEVDSHLLRERQFLNPYCFIGYDSE